MLVVLLTDKPSLEAYGPHPLHKQYAAECILPSVEAGGLLVSSTPCPGYRARCHSSRSSAH
jgi:hypothetical protein